MSTVTKNKIIRQSLIFQGLSERDIDLYENLFLAVLRSSRDDCIETDILKERIVNDMMILETWIPREESESALINEIRALSVCYEDDGALHYAVDVLCNGLRMPEKACAGHSGDDGFIEILLIARDFFKSLNVIVLNKLALTPAKREVK